MSSTERIKIRLTMSGSSLAKHSMNQDELKRGVHGESVLENTINGTKVIQRARSKKEKLQEEERQHEESKFNRIAWRVLQTLNGYDGANPEGFVAEVNYLIKNCK